MKIEGTYTFDAPREMVYNLLQDPEVLAKIIPGCEQLTKIAENEYEAALELSVGPIKGKFKGKVELSELQPPESYRMAVSGNGAPGFVKGSGLVQLSEQEATTLMSYDGEAQIGGRIASVGQRLVESAAKAMIRQSLEGVNQHIQAHVQVQVDAATQAQVDTDLKAEAQANEAEAVRVATAQKVSVTPPPIQPPSQIEFATGVAKGVLDDLVPADRRPILIGAGLAGVVLFFILTRRSKKSS